MTQENKELLLRDLSARLTYGVIVDYKEDEYDFHHWKISTLHAPAYSQSGSLINTDSDGWIEYNEYKGCGMSTGSRPLHLEKNLPFLRPMSSMTDEELKEFRRLKQMSVTVVMPNGVSLLKPTYIVDLEDDGDGLNHLYDWLNAHHFDYRGLIEKGLALEAPKDMYNIK
jgi:hypothetical protein